MIHGGIIHQHLTELSCNYNIMSTGANLVPQFVPDITSYDYDAPITEAGDLTEKYFAIKQLLESVSTFIIKIIILLLSCITK